MLNLKGIAERGKDLPRAAFAIQCGQPRIDLEQLAALAGLRRLGRKGAVDHGAAVDLLGSAAANARPMQADRLPIQVGVRAEAAQRGNHRRKAPREPAVTTTRRDTARNDKREGIFAGIGPQPVIQPDGSLWPAP